MPCTHAAETELTERCGAGLDGILLPVQPGAAHGLAWSGTQGCQLGRAQVHALGAAAGAITIFAQVIVQKVAQAVSRQCSGRLAPILHAAYICAAHLVWVGSGWAGGDVWGLRLQGCSMRDQVEESQHCFKSWLRHAAGHMRPVGSSAPLAAQVVVHSMRWVRSICGARAAHPAS